MKTQINHSWQHIAITSLFLILCCEQFTAKGQGRIIEEFNKDWRFYLGENEKAADAAFEDTGWRKLNLPHDWSIEGKFDKDHPAGIGGGALPGGIGWYMKTFHVPLSSKGKLVFIEFDGVYKNSEVWINGNYLGKRPNGYIAFSYELSKYLKYGTNNVVTVKADNSQQPNSRWYSGSGIYRDVKLLTVNKLHIEQWGTFVTTPVVSKEAAKISIETSIKSAEAKPQNIVLKTIIRDANKHIVASASKKIAMSGSATKTYQDLELKNPNLWSDTGPYLYTVESQVWANNQLVDTYPTSLGIRTFEFDAAKGFILNGKPVKIKGVCNHHDLGALGAAFNKRAAERQLEILKKMGCNGIRTSHNPPAKELLNLCDEMGFIVMDEAFDMWKKKKSDFDYHLDWDQWHKRDLEDQIKRDRNHPSVFVWSTGNEIQEQWGSGADTSGRVIARELTAIVKSLDTTRPITTANNEVNLYNNLIQSGAMDIIGYNYNHNKWKDFHQTYPGKKLIITESTSALQTRGHYDMPSDSIRIWPTAWDKPLLTGNTDLTCSAYDNCRTPWGSSHEETLKNFKSNPAVSGIYVWTGFDYLGEPTPYPWPARSSYFGIVDLAGFPKDVYHLYKSEWTNEPVLHVLPHWNWRPGQTIDVWAYYSQADEVELFLNGKSLGTKTKQNDELHILWRVVYQPGVLKAVSRKNGRVVLEKTIETAGRPTKIVLEADRDVLHADGKDLSFVTVKVIDDKGNLIPDADHLINFEIKGNATLAGVDNGSPTSMESFKANHRKAFNGLALAIVQAGESAETINLTASAKGLKSSTLTIKLTQE
jgi:beta-galactosidase